MTDRHRTLATGGGFVAIALWSATVGVSRLLTESLGPLTAGAGIYSVAGVLGCLWFYRTRAARQNFRRLPRRYLFVCGGLFVAYTVFLYIAVGLASGRRQVLEVSLINYLWPALTLVFAIPILGKRPRRLFAVGVAMALAGVVTATWPEGGLRWGVFVQNLSNNRWPYLLAAAAAVMWGVYSPLVRRWAADAAAPGIPAFVLATGVTMTAMRFAFGESSDWSAPTVGILAFMALGPALTGYSLWDHAIKRGSVTLVASAAYLTPVLSTLVGSAVLGLIPGAGFWIGCALVVGGAVLCRANLR